MTPDEMLDAAEQAEVAEPQGTPIERIARALEKIAPSLENVSITGVLRSTNDDTSKLSEELYKLREQYEKLETWTSDNAQHKNDCGFWFPGNNKPENRYNVTVCTCGLAKLLETQKLKDD